MKHYKLRLIAIFNILFRHEHAIILSFSSETYAKILMGEDVNLKLTHIGLRKHGAYEILEDVVECADKLEIALDRAKFEGELEYKNMERESE